MSTNQTLAQQLDHAVQKFTKWRGVFAGWQLGTRTTEDEECRAVRDHREVTMMLRAELNAFLGLLVAKGLITDEEWAKQMLNEVQHLDKQYEKKFPGFKTTAYGLSVDTRIAADTTRNWNP